MSPQSQKELHSNTNFSDYDKLTSLLMEFQLFRWLISKKRNFFEYVLYWTSSKIFGLRICLLNWSRENSSAPNNAPKTSKQCAVLAKGHAIPGEIQWGWGVGTFHGWRLKNIAFSWLTDKVFGCFTVDENFFLSWWLYFGPFDGWRLTVNKAHWDPLPSKRS